MAVGAQSVSIYRRFPLPPCGGGEVRGGAVRLIKPEWVRIKIVEGGFYLGQEGWDVGAREGGVVKHQALGTVPYIGVMRIAMGGDAACIGEFRGGEALGSAGEQAVQRLAIFRAVDDEAQAGEFVPRQSEARKRHLLPGVETA